MINKDRRRLVEILNLDCPFADEMKERVVKAIIANASEELIEYGTELDDGELLKVISNGMGLFLQSFHARPAFKQKIYEKLVKWHRALEARFDLHLDGYVEAWPIPIAEDTGIALVKQLHDRQGLTKKQLAINMGVNEKTIQTGVRKLDSSLCHGDSSMNNEPFRIAGQEMHIRINEKVLPGSRGDKRYCVPETMHPLALQLNVTQVGSLLLALMQERNEGASGTACFETAMDVWCQLSDYGQERMKQHFAILYP